MTELAYPSSHKAVNTLLENSKGRDKVQVLNTCLAYAGPWVDSIHCVVHLPNTAECDPGGP